MDNNSSTKCYHENKERLQKKKKSCARYQNLFEEETEKIINMVKIFLS